MGAVIWRTVRSGSSSAIGERGAGTGGPRTLRSSSPPSVERPSPSTIAILRRKAKPVLNLTYALTFHKAQGSEVAKVMLVLPRSPLMVTRELLYTALTRQKDKVVVLLQGSATDLHRFSSDRYSAVVCRLTNLFRPPNPIEFRGRFLEEHLIHNTAARRAGPIQI